MTNPWLSISLADYEAHMALPEVGQAEALASELENLVRSYHPVSFALLGCAGGNGLERVDPKTTRRVVALDVNPAFVDATAKRFAGVFDGFETITFDMTNVERAPFDPVDAMFAGLVLEYVPLVPALRFVRSGLNRGALFGCVIQQESDALPAVSASPYAESLSVLSDHIRTLAPQAVVEAAALCGLESIRTRTLEMPNGKVLVSQTFAAA